MTCLEHDIGAGDATIAIGNTAERMASDVPRFHTSRSSLSLTVHANRPLIDGHGRTIDHLRLSVTSACNLRCLYCRPTIRTSACRADLSDAQRVELVKHLYDHRGLRQLRLTGGEPLMHPAIIPLIESLRLAAPLLPLAMTTNALFLASMAVRLREAGIDRLNISLDTIDPSRYRALTGGRVEDAIRGIDAALAAGFPSPKLNTVVLDGINDDQIIELARWAMERALEIRFLEAMPIGPAAEFNRKHFVPARRMKAILASHFRLAPLERCDGETAMRYVVNDGSVRGTIGIIAPISESFCGQCRRMRLTADGKLFPCLLDSRHIDLKDCWQEGIFDSDAVDRLIEQAIFGKNAHGSLHQQTGMITLGG